MRILLIQPDSPAEIIGWGDLGAIAEPLALEYLSAGAQLEGHEAKLLDLRLYPGTLLQEIKAFKPDVAAVTGYSMHVLRNLEICRQIKNLIPNCYTLAGGHHATLLPADFFEPEIDFVVTGEGVTPFRTILRLIEKGAKSISVPAVWTRDPNNKFHFGGEAPPFEIDNLVFPNRKITANDRNEYYIDWMRPIALMRNTVGCPYRCSFCSLWKIMDGRYYKRELSQVIEELAAIQEDFVFFVDDEAFVDNNRMFKLAAAIKDAGIKKKYFTYCRIDTLIRSRKLMEEWHEIGLERLFIGIESITDEELLDYNKRLRVAQVEEGLRAAREIGIKVFAGFIVHPNYTERSFKRLVNFIEHNKVDYPSFTIWTPLPGTDALKSFDEVIERQPNGRPNWELFDLQHPVTKTRLPREKFMREYHKLHKVFAPQYAEHRDLNRIIENRKRRSQHEQYQPW